MQDQDEPVTFSYYMDNRKREEVIRLICKHLCHDSEDLARFVSMCRFLIREGEEDSMFYTDGFTLIRRAIEHKERGYPLVLADGLNLGGDDPTIFFFSLDRFLDYATRTFPVLTSMETRQELKMVATPSWLLLMGREHSAMNNMFGNEDLYSETGCPRTHTNPGLSSDSYGQKSGS